MEKLYAGWHHLDFRPPKDSKLPEDCIPDLCQILGIDFAEIEDRSYSAESKKRGNIEQTNQYVTTQTYHRMVDFEFKLSPKHGRCLNRLVLHGKAFELLNLDIGHIFTELERVGYRIREAHARFLLPPSAVTWDTINSHFREDAFTCNCKMVSPIKDPSNDYATTWQCAKRPNNVTDNTEGRRLTFYEAYKVHPELPVGTTEMELQLFGAMAHKFIYGDLTRGVDLTLKTIGVIRSYFSFKTLDGESNRSRRPSPEFWNQIVDNLPAIYIPRLKREKPQLTGQKKKFKQLLFARYQNLGAEDFAQTIADFALEVGISGAIARSMTTF